MRKLQSAYPNIVLKVPLQSKIYFSSYCLSFTVQNDACAVCFHTPLLKVENVCIDLKSELKGKYLQAVIVTSQHICRYSWSSTQHT